MVNFIEATERGVNFCYTSKPLRIDKIVIERNLRSRRKLEVEDEVVERVVLPMCGFCGKPLVVARFRHLKSGIEKDTCDYCSDNLRERSDWVEVVSK